MPEVPAFGKIASLDELKIIDVPFVLQSTGLLAGFAFLETLYSQYKQSKMEKGSIFIPPDYWDVKEEEEKEEYQEALPLYMDRLFDHLKDDKEFHKGYIGLEERFGDYRQLTERHIGREQLRTAEEHIRSLGKTVRGRDLMIDRSSKNRFDNNKYN